MFHHVDITKTEKPSRWQYVCVQALGLWTVNYYGMCAERDAWYSRYSCEIWGSV